MSPFALHKLGFSLILLKPESKQPVDGKWSQGPRRPLTEIVDGLDEGYNLGFRPGITSKTADQKYVHVIDLDIRVEEDRDEAIAALEERFGRKFLKNCARVQSGSGGSSRHFMFTMDRPMRAKTIAHSKEKFLCPKTNKMRWKWEIEVFGEGKQIVLPPSIHPDTKKEYRWIKEPHDLPNLDADVLDQILDELTRSASDFDEEELKPLGIKLREAEDILEKLDFNTWFEERNGWRNVGMALHHEFGGSQDAYKLWSKYSRKSKSFDSSEQRYQWSTFGRNTQVRPFRMASLIKEAGEAEIRAALMPTDEDAEELREVIALEKARKEKREVERRPRDKAPVASSVSGGDGKKYRIRQPKELLTVPGILGEVVDLFNETAPRPQPQFAVHAALALGSVICSRNWVTDGGNYSSLYFLMLGNTASGKEHGLKLVEKVLNECELDTLVGPPRYTADAGVMGALEAKPKHVSLSDEFSRYLKSARTSGDANQSNAQSTLMEIWGRLDGTHRNKGYSTRGLSKAQIESMTNSYVTRPAVTILGAATPMDFYNAIGTEDVANGFLNRFLICETEVPRLAMRRSRSKISVSAKFKRWARDIAYPMLDDDEDIMDAMARNDPLNPGEPILIPFTQKAWRMLDEIDEFCLRKMDELDACGMDGLYGRAREIIMRLSLIVALSCGEDEIRVENVKWSRDYFMYHATRMENRTKDDMGASELQQVVNACFIKIEEYSDNPDTIGITTREIIHSVWKFKNLDTRSREEVIKLLMSDKGVVIRNVKRPGRMNAKTVKVLTTNHEE